MHCKYIWWFWALLVITAGAAPGDLDPTFGNGGSLFELIGDERITSAQGTDVAVQGDGKILIGGYVQFNFGGDNGFLLVRYNVDGTLDTTFNGVGYVILDITDGTDQAWALALQPDGKIVLTGTTRSSASESFSDLATVRLTPAGALDSSFGTGGIVITGLGDPNGIPYGNRDDIARDVVVQPDGKIVVACTAAINEQYAATLALVRYLPNGDLDSTFDTDGVATAKFSGNTYAEGLALDPGGCIFVCGRVDLNRCFIAKFFPSGEVDWSFGTGGVAKTSLGGSESSGKGLALQEDGKILVAGDTKISSSLREAAVARFLPNGALDSAFGMGGVARVAVGGFASGYDIALQNDKKIVVAGDGPTPSHDALVFRLTSEGVLDSGFGQGGISFANIGPNRGTAYSLALQPDGKIVTAGWIELNGPFKVAVARFEGGPFPPAASVSAPFGVTTTAATLSGTVNPNGGTTTAQFEYGTSTAYGTVVPVVLSPDNGTVTQAVIAPISGLMPGTTHYFRLSAANADGEAYAGGTFRTIGTNAKLASLTLSSGDLSPPFMPSTSGYTAAVDYPTTYISVTPTAEDAGAVVEVNGAVVPSGSPSGPIPLAVGANVITIQVTAEDGVTTHTYSLSVARSPSGPGALDPFFGSGGKGGTSISSGIDTPGGMVLQPDGKILLAGSVNSSSDAISPRDFGLARFNVDGSLDAEFGVAGKVVRSLRSGDDYCMDCAVFADGRIALAGWSHSGLDNDFALAMLLPDGSLDSGFNGTGIVLTEIGPHSEGVEAMVIQPDGKLVVAGSVGVSRPGIPTDIGVARYNSNGTLDGSFGSSGFVTTQIGNYSSTGKCVALDADGRILVAGGTYNGSHHDVAVVRYLNDGSLDQTFGVSGVVTTDVAGFTEVAEAMDIQRDGKIVVGVYIQGNPDRPIGIIRYNADGSVDTDFGESGVVITQVGSSYNYLNDLRVQANGKIVVGIVANPYPNYDFTLVRYAPDGSVDLGFGSEGIVVTDFYGHNDQIRGIAIDSQGRIVAGGSSSDGVRITNGKNQDFALARYVGDPASPDIRVSGAGLEIANGDLIASEVDHTSFGYRAFGESQTRVFTVKNEGTGLLHLYSPTVTVFGDHPSDFEVTGFARTYLYPGETTEVSIRFSPQGSGVRSAVVRLVSDDVTAGIFEFAIEGVGPSDNAQMADFTLTGASLSPQFSPTTFSYTSSVPYHVDQLGVIPLVADSNSIVRLNGIEVNSGSTTTLTLSLGNNVVTVDVIAQDEITTRSYTAVVTRLPPTAGYPDELDVAVGGGNVYCALEQPDGKLVIAGSFTSVLGATRHRIARINANGSLDQGFDPKANDTVYCIAIASDGRMWIGGAFTSLQPNGGPTVLRYRLARLLSSGALDPSFDSSFDGPVHSLVPGYGDELLVGGTFESVVPTGGGASYSRGGIAKVGWDGSVDVAFNPMSNGGVFTISRQQDGKVLLGGDFTTLNPGGAGVPIGRNRIARVDDNGNLDSGFDPNANAAVRCVLIQPDGRILLGGDFTTLKPNGAAAAVNRWRIARLEANGSVDLGFDPKPNNQVRSMVLQADGRIVVGGGFSGFSPNGSASSIPRRFVARIESSGLVDEAFDPRANNWVWTTALQKRGEILIGGAFTSLNPNFLPQTIVQAKLARLFNDAASSSLTVADSTRIRWSLMGAFPQMSSVTFEESFDNGTTWSLLGLPSFRSETSAWELSGLVLSGRGVIRARGRSTSGYYNGSSGLIEEQTSFDVVNQDLDADGLPDSWEITHFGSITGHTALSNFDHDSYCELLEFAFGFNPTRPDPGGFPPTMIESGYLTMVINKRPGISYEVQSAGTLAEGLSTSFSKGSTTILIDSSSILKVRDNVPMSAGGVRFIRVSVTVQP